MEQFSLSEKAWELYERLAQYDRRLVLAESCTGGLVAAELAARPGISRRLCGSFVVYREDSKRRWLGVDPSTLEQFSAVSPQVAEQMVRGALEKTPEADLAASVTGYLGPNAPDGMDGLVFVAVGRRTLEKTVAVTIRELHFDAICSADEFDQRRQRQRAAAVAVMETLVQIIASPTDD